MKTLLFRIIVPVAFLLLSLFSNAQNFSGLVTYQEKFKLSGSGISDEETKDLPDEMKDQIKDLLSKNNSSKTYQLTFDKNASLYELGAKEEEKDIKNGNVIMKTVISTPEAIIYRNLKEKQEISEKDIFGKKFLVTGNLDIMNWKLTNETKKIGNYTVYKAIMETSINTNINGKSDTKSKSEIVAWYTKEIPVGHGPNIYYGLPGLVLEVESDYNTIICTKIILNPKDKPEIKAPVKGKKITNEEFEKIQMEKFEQFKKENKDGKSIKIEYIGN